MSITLHFIEKADTRRGLLDFIEADWGQGEVRPNWRLRMNMRNVFDLM